MLGLPTEWCCVCTLAHIYTYFVCVTWGSRHQCLQWQHRETNDRPHWHPGPSVSCLMLVTGRWEEPRRLERNPRGHSGGAQTTHREVRGNQSHDLLRCADGCDPGLTAESSKKCRIIKKKQQKLCCFGFIPYDWDRIGLIGGPMAAITNDWIKVGHMMVNCMCSASFLFGDIYPSPSQQICFSISGWQLSHQQLITICNVCMGFNGGYWAIPTMFFSACLCTNH